jgi:hypothetical protein
MKRDISDVFRLLAEILKMDKNKCPIPENRPEPAKNRLFKTVIPWRWRKKWFPVPKNVLYTHFFWTFLKNV